MKNNEKEILTPSHKHWPKFRKVLDDTVSIYRDEKLRNQCKGDLSLSIAILQSLENIDVKETVILFKEYGGSCDCKVIMNVARIWNNR
jgi:hypothetical protein